VLSNGWTAVDGNGLLFTKTFTGNVNGEIVRFETNGFEEEASVTIDRIDRTPPEAVSVDYSTTGATNQPVEVTLTLNKTGTVAMT
jgi:hypothetical protein